MSFAYPHMDIEFVDPYKEQQEQNKKYKPESLFEIKKNLLYNNLLQEGGHNGKIHGFSNKRVGQLLGTKERQSHKYIKQLEKEGKIHIKVFKFCIPSTKRWVNERWITINANTDHPEAKRAIEQMKDSITYQHHKKAEARKKIAIAVSRKRKEINNLPKHLPSPYAYDMAHNAYRDLKTTPKKYRERLKTAPPHIRAIIEDMTDDYDIKHELEKVERFIKMFKM
jgi:hypothetical protein